MKTCPYNPIRMGCTAKVFWRFKQVHYRNEGPRRNGRQMRGSPLTLRAVVSTKYGFYGLCFARCTILTMLVTDRMGLAQQTLSGLQIQRHFVRTRAVPELREACKHCRLLELQSGPNDSDGEHSGEIRAICLLRGKLRGLLE